MYKMHYASEFGTTERGAEAAVGQELLRHAVELELNELLMLNPPASNPYPLREVPIY